MKPRIFFRDGCWRCHSYYQNVPVTGCGPNAWTAYVNWLNNGMRA